MLYIAYYQGGLRIVGRVRANSAGICSRRGAKWQPT